MPNKSRSLRGAQRVSPLAPLRSLVPSFTLRKTFRFVADAAVDFALFPNHIIGLVGSGFHSVLPANGVYNWIDAFKIERVKLLYVNDASVVPATVLLDWASTTTPRSNSITSTSLGIQPAIIDAKPPRNSDASFWHGVGTNVLCRMVLPVNGIVEITISMVLTDNGGNFSPCSSTLTDAKFYIKPLDTVLNSFAGHLQPQGYANVVLV